MVRSHATLEAGNRYRNVHINVETVLKLPSGALSYMLSDEMCSPRIDKEVGLHGTDYINKRQEPEVKFHLHLRIYQGRDQFPWIPPDKTHRYSISETNPITRECELRQYGSAWKRTRMGGTICEHK